MLSGHFVSASMYYQYTIIGPDNDLVPSRQQAIIWTNDG